MTQDTRAAPALDAGRIRKDFPILARTMRGKPLVYLDSAATSQRPQQVVDAMDDFTTRYNAPAHRSVYELAEQSTDAYEGARARIAAFVNAPEPECVVFTRNTTEAINLIAYSWARRHLGPGDEILCTVMEHHSNLVPWQMAARDTGATLRYLGVTDGGELEFEPSDVTERTRLVAVTAMSNVLGTIVDVASIASVAHDAGALVVVDGAQYVPHAPTDFAAMGADVLAFSAHKMCGPTGVGCLVARRDLLESMDPFLGGGEMIRDVTLEGSTWTDVPWKFEAGSQAVAEVIGFGAAVDYLSAIGMDAVRSHEVEMAAYGIERLSSVDGLVLYGPTDASRRGAALSFNVSDGLGGFIHPHDVAQVLDQEGIAIRVGHHCAKPLMRRLDVAATCRASCYLYNTPGEIDALVEGIGAARRFFAG